MPLARAALRPKKIYSPMPGSRLSPKEAEIYGRRLSYLERTGDLTAEAVLEDAKDPRSPLHKYFLWDDKKAAVKYRITQASYLLRAIAIQIVGPRGEITETRAFHNVAIPVFENDEEYSVRVYKSSNQVFDDDDLRAQVIAQAREALEGWRDRYERYSELSGVSFLIRRAIKVLQTDSRRRGSKKTKAVKARKGSASKARGRQLRSG